MITKIIEVNGTEFKLTLTDQVISHVNDLKNLYNAAYEDPESFEEVSAEISSTINEILPGVFDRRTAHEKGHSSDGSDHRGRHADRGGCGIGQRAFVAGGG